MACESVLSPDGTHKVQGSRCVYCGSPDNTSGDADKPMSAEEWFEHLSREELNKLDTANLTQRGYVGDKFIFNVAEAYAAYVRKFWLERAKKAVCSNCLYGFPHSDGICFTIRALIGD